MSETLLDPTSGLRPTSRQLAARLGSLDGKTVGLLDISKDRGSVFLDRVEECIADRGASVQRYMKPTFSKRAPADLRSKIAEQCDAVIEALAD